MLFFNSKTGLIDIYLKAFILSTFLFSVTFGWGQCPPGSFVEIGISTDGSNPLPPTIGGGTSAICANEPFMMTLLSIDQGEGFVQLVYNVRENDINGDVILLNQTTGEVGLGDTLYFSPGGTLEPGTYFIETLSITDSLGCQVESGVMAAGYYNHTLIVNESPTANIFPNSIMDTICPNTDLAFSSQVIGGQGPYEFEWTDNDYFNDHTIENPIFNSSSSGTFTVELMVTDDNGCTTSSAVSFVVGDDIDPICSAVNSDLTFVALPTECSAIVVFDLPMGTDNCTPDPVSTNITGQPVSGDRLNLGTHTINYLITDANENSTTCTFNITVEDFENSSLGCKPVNVSVDESCQAILVPTTVLTGWEHPSGIPQIGCVSLFEINVIGPNGEDLGNTVGIDQLGKTLMYSISHPTIPTCMNTVSVEDKIKPVIECPGDSIHINCLADPTLVEYPVELISDNCSPLVFARQIREEQYIPLECDSNYIGRVIRTYKAVDGAGNESENLCQLVINLERSSFTGIVAPDNVVYKCTDSYITDTKGRGFPEPNPMARGFNVLGSGVPTTMGGDTIYPTSQLTMQYCNAVIDYTDEVLFESPCKTRIMRTWHIYEWWCSGTVKHPLPGQPAIRQMIDIIDDEAPVIPQEKNSVVTTQSRSCTGRVELPTLNITDNCNAFHSIFINAVDSTTLEPTGTVNGNGGVLMLGVGTHRITYTAIDICKNTSTMSYYITVRDNTAPVALCNQSNSVSIRMDGLSYLTATSVDNDSYDECGDVDLKIQRMEDPLNLGQDTQWLDQVIFDCTDAFQTRMVTLLVTDKGGNTNMCMISVNIQDKVNPRITCPDDMTINDCSFAFDPSLSGANNAFGAPDIFDNCPSMTEVTQVLADNRETCGTGTVIRTLTVWENGVAHGSCTQSVTINNDSPFDFESIVWPQDYEAISQCSLERLLPEMLPVENGFPIYTEDNCDQVGMTYEDEVFPFAGNGACYKIIRTWYVMDWCTKHTEDRQQEIKIVDNTAPEISVPDTLVVFETFNCESSVVTVGASATDNCTPIDELIWTYEIRSADTLVVRGNTPSVTRTFFVGEYTMFFTVRDRCGNADQGQFDFVVETSKTGSLVCKGARAKLVLMNNEPMAMVTPEMFDVKNTHPCNVPFSLSFSSTLNDTLRTFTCDSIGDRAIHLWAIDENGNTNFCETIVEVQHLEVTCRENLPPITLVDVAGTPSVTIQISDIDNGSSSVCDIPFGLSFSETSNVLSLSFTCNDIGQRTIQLWATDDLDSTQAFCETTIEIVDMNNICGNQMMSVVSGRIVRENGDAIADVLVELEGGESGPEMTDEEGRFTFAPMSAGGAYDVFPQKNTGHVNGVSTLDLVMIQRHILAIEPLKSPYQLLAADANNTGSISASDLTEVRKVVLGMTETFQNNASWRFIDAQHRFADDKNPWYGGLYERYQIDNLNSDMDIDFIGIKVGDVNNSAKANNAQKKTESRSVSSMIITDKKVSRGQWVEIPVRWNGDGMVYGLQGEWTSRGLLIKGITSDIMNTENGEVVKNTPETIRMSMIKAEGVNLSGEDILYTIEAEVLRDGYLSEMLTLTEGLENEVYTEDLRTENIRIEWQTNTAEPFVVEGVKPNPWQSNTAIDFTIPEDGQVMCHIKDVTGRVVYQTTSLFNKGRNQILINKSDLGVSGLYVFELVYNSETVTGKMILLD